MRYFTYKLFTEPGCKITPQLISFLEKEKIRGSIIDLTSKKANSEPLSFKILNVPTLILYDKQKEMIDHVFSLGDLKEIFRNKK
ncbi:MAG: hypothetical protein KAT77_00815 [Nanoarchaeota archaeon]|nr:hypothetical protein [Nanoarchaeota archaeon]